MRWVAPGERWPWPEDDRTPLVRTQPCVGPPANTMYVGGPDLPGQFCRASAIPAGATQWADGTRWRPIPAAWLDPVNWPGGCWRPGPGAEPSESPEPVAHGCAVPVAALAVPAVTPLVTPSAPAADPASAAGSGWHRCTCGRPAVGLFFTDYSPRGYPLGGWWLCRPCGKAFRPPRCPCGSEALLTVAVPDPVKVQGTIEARRCVRCAGRTRCPDCGDAVPFNSKDNVCGRCIRRAEAMAT